MTTNDDLAAQLDRVCSELAELRQTYRRSLRVGRVLIGAAMLVAVLAAWVGVAAIRQQDRTNRQTDAARITACLNQNAATSDDVRGVKSDQATFVDLLFPPPHSPSVQKRIDAGLKIYNAGVDAHHKLRDCSPAGVHAYLSGTVPPLTSTTVPASTSTLRP